MNSEGLFSILTAIVTVAMISAILRRGDRAAKLVKALGDAFSGSITAAISNG